LKFCFLLLNHEKKIELQYKESLLQNNFKYRDFKKYSTVKSMEYFNIISSVAENVT